MSSAASKNSKQPYTQIPQSDPDSGVGSPPSASTPTPKPPPPSHFNTDHQEHNESSQNELNDVNDDFNMDVDQFELQAINSFDYELDIVEDTEEEPETGRSSMRMAFMNMANSILGAGIIGQPFAFRNSGLIGGIIVMVFLTMLIDWTLRLIVINSHLSQTKSYQDTVNYCYGKYGKILLLFAISSFAYGGCMAFCVIIGDTIPHVLKAFIPKSVWGSESIVGWLFKRNSIIVLFTTCISYPLSLNRDISKLAKASGFALVGMLIIVVLTVARAPFVDPSLKAKLTTLEWTVNFNIFQGISVISFALVCHHNTILIYQSMKNATLKKFAKLTHISCGVSMVCCLVMGICGLLNFGDNTKGNILNNFKSDDNWINVARFCFGLNMLTTFPLEIFVVRDVLKDIVLTDESGSTANLELDSRQHFIITTVLVFSSMAVSLFTCNLGMILELIGATSASLMAYIIPPLCYLKLSWDGIDYKNAGKQDKRKFLLWKAFPSITCIIFGFAVMFISSFMSIRTSLKDTSGGHCVDD
ncbi:transmembrane amino acid transporter protein-domain-containing protein [Scheffersomyces xylosifermentans]|uniref:transmembrane amino acid transporter protein-domain-containing protein n=1 Tax=Scheffersomyces xylosifermentans TaxID=1304137 RepID=UPI00315D6FC7